MDQELITIPQQNALSVFTREGQIEPFLQIIRKQIDEFVPIIDTARGRQEVKSFAHNITRSKAYLEGVGKRLADEQKAIPKLIDATRKRVKDTLEGWHDEARKPLTDWENAEKNRINRHTDAIATIMAHTAHPPSADAATLRQALAVMDRIEIGPECEEFEAEYARAKDQATRGLRDALARREQYEAEQLELTRLRAEAEERVAKDREEAIRREATERAEAQAAAAAQAEKSRVEAAAQAERDKAEAAAKAERDAAERRELELKLAAEAAERRALEAEQRVKREAAEAAAREATEAAKRESDRKHAAAINRAAVEAFVVGGIAEDVARAVVTLIAKRIVPHVSISY